VQYLLVDVNVSREHPLTHRAQTILHIASALAKQHIGLGGVHVQRHAIIATI
jgi:hypothetical protein